MAESQAQTGELRENLIETAVKFLQNPKVRESPFAQRRVFLEKKGLSPEEIEAAVAQSGTADDEHVSPTQAVQPSYQPPPPITPASPWNRTKDYLATAIVLGGVGYAIYKVYKLYLAPMWFGPGKEEIQLANIEASVKSLQENMVQTLKNIEAMQCTVNKQQESLQRGLTDGSVKNTSDLYTLQERQYVNDIKEEIKSLKGLLLNRKQFPPTPKTTPVIPSWQLEAAKKPSTRDQPTTEDEENELALKSSEGEASTPPPEVNEHDAIETDPAMKLAEEGVTDVETATKSDEITDGASNPPTEDSVHMSQ